MKAKTNNKLAVKMLIAMIAGIGLPNAFGHFADEDGERPQGPPYIYFSYSDRADFHADGINYVKIAQLTIELCTVAPDFVLQVSHLGILSQALDRTCKDAGFQSQAVEYISQKNTHDLSRLCKEYGADDTLLTQLVSAYGDRSRVLAQLEALGCSDPALQELSDLLDVTPWAERITFDFSLVNNRKYYNGIVFRGFLSGISESVLAGGQYDKLMQKLDRRAGAVGFAVYMDLLEGEWYQIYNAEQFIKNARPKGNYVIHADLDFEGEIWPSSLMYGNFAGAIQGNGHKISNVVIEQTNNSKLCSGLFGQLTETAVISDLTLENVTFTIAGSSLQDHPTYKVFRDAAALLNSMGWNVEVVCDTQALTKINTGALEVWAAAWSSALDPDLYQVYHKDSTATSTLAWGYNYLKTSGSAQELDILDEMSDLIDKARETNDKSVRADLYEEAMGYVLDLAVELPVYQRDVLYAYNANVIKSDSLPSDVNPFSSPLDRIWEIEFAN